MQNHNKSIHAESNNVTQKENVGLTALVNQVKLLLETKYTKKIEDLEFQLLEKEELISQMGLEVSTLKAQNEEKDIEIYRMREEINESKKSLEQLVEILSKTQD